MSHKRCKELHKGYIKDIYCKKRRGHDGKHNFGG